MATDDAAMGNGPWRQMLCPPAICAPLMHAETCKTSACNSCCGLALHREASLSTAASETAAVEARMCSVKGVKGGVAPVSSIKVVLCVQTTPQHL